MKRKNYYLAAVTALLVTFSSGANADGWRHRDWNDRDEGERYEHRGHHRHHERGYRDGWYYVVQPQPVYYYPAPQPVYYPPVYRQPAYYLRSSLLSFGINAGH